MTPARLVFLFLSVTTLAGCAVGPDFERPKLDPEAGYLGSGDATAGRATGTSLA